MCQKCLKDLTEPGCVTKFACMLDWLFAKLYSERTYVAITYKSIYLKEKQTFSYGSSLRVSALILYNSEV